MLNLLKGYKNKTNFNLYKQSMKHQTMLINLLMTKTAICQFDGKTYLAMLR